MTKKIKGVAKLLTPEQQKRVEQYILDNSHFKARNMCIYLFSLRAGLRAKEIAGLRWCDVMSGGEIGVIVHVPRHITKARKQSRDIPMHPQLKHWLQIYRNTERYGDNFIFYSCKGKPLAPQKIVDFFWETFKRLGMDGHSSHSGRRTFITELARVINNHGGSIRDVQKLAGHQDLTTTQIYIDINEAAVTSAVSVLGST